MHDMKTPKLNSSDSRMWRRNGVRPRMKRVQCGLQLRSLN